MVKVDAGIFFGYISVILTEQNIWSEIYTYFNHLKFCMLQFLQ